METFFNWLPNAEKFHISGRGDVYAGACPFGVDKSKEDWTDRFYKCPWVISHADTMNKVFMVIGIESYAIQTIRQGQPVGLLVREITDEELDAWWPVETGSKLQNKLYKTRGF